VRREPQREAAERPTIAVVLAQFLTEQDQRLAPKTVAQYRERYTRKLWTGGMKKAAYPSG